MAPEATREDLTGRFIDRMVSATKWLVLPVALLLMLQWPARELIGRFSHEADDFGQMLFALYIAVAVTCATQRESHLATDILAHRYPPWVRTALARAVPALTLLPWTLFVLVTSAPMVWRSIVNREAFPETFVPGYFIVKAAIWVLAAMLLLQSLAATLRRSEPDTDR